MMPRSISRGVCTGCKGEFKDKNKCVHTCKEVAKYQDRVRGSISFGCGLADDFCGDQAAYSKSRKGQL